jgi:hypothetical protein
VNRPDDAGQHGRFVFFGQVAEENWSARGSC